MTRLSFSILLVSLIVILVASQSIYVVNETERAVVLKFGEIVSANVKPGLHVKIPFVHEVKKFDSRILTIELDAQRYLTREKKVVLATSYVQWKIKSVAQYYKTTSGHESVANQVLSSRVETALRNQFGAQPMDAMVSDAREKLITMLCAALDKVAQSELGIKVVDIQVKRIELPPNVSASVYRRMRAERQRKAGESRAQGFEKAEFIRADADRKCTILKARARRTGEARRGNGDAQAAAIYAKVYKQDPEFYDFYRSLQAYRDSFTGKKDLFVLQPDGEFFKYLNSASPIKSPIK